MAEVGAGADSRPAAIAPGHHPEPIFLLAPARSYSTISVALLAGHPAIFGFPELLLFASLPEAATVGRLLGEQPDRSGLPAQWISARQSGVLRAVAAVHEASQSSEALDHAGDWLRARSDWTTVQLMNHLLDLVSPLIGLEKSPDTVTTDLRLASCLTAYPNARFIHLTRHPVSSQKSMQAYWSALPSLDDRTLVAASASAWYLAHRRIVRSLSLLRDDQWFRVRAEDLLSDPKRHLPDLLRWLRLPCSESTITRMLRTQDWCFAGTGPSGDLFGGDPCFMSSPAMQPIKAPAPVSFDPPWPMPSAMTDRIRRLAEYLGY